MEPALNIPFLPLVEQPLTMITSTIKQTITSIPTATVTATVCPVINAEERYEAATERLVSLSSGAALNETLTFAIIIAYFMVLFAIFLFSVAGTARTALRSYWHCCGKCAIYHVPEARIADVKRLEEKYLKEEEEGSRERLSEKCLG